MTSPEEHYGALGQATGALLGQQATSPPRYGPYYGHPVPTKYSHKLISLLEGTKEALRTQGTEAGRGKTLLGKTGDSNRKGIGTMMLLMMAMMMLMMLMVMMLMVMMLMVSMRIVRVCTPGGYPGWSAQC